MYIQENLSNNILINIILVSDTFNFYISRIYLSLNASM